MSSLQKLLVWLSPAFPIGSFAWSGGLETAIASGQVTDRATTQSWVAANLDAGSHRTDAILLAHAHKSFENAETLQSLADLALALIPARQRVDETLALGAAFRLAANAWPNPATAHLPPACPYPIAIGAIAAAQQVPLADTLTAFLTAAVHAQISVAVRLVPIGQTDGLTILAALESHVAAIAAFTHDAALEDIGAIAYAADIAQMRHETQHTRIFKS